MIKLEEGEKLIKVVHRHWFVLLSHIFLLLLMAVAPIVLYVFLASGKFSVMPAILRSYLISEWAWGAYAYSLWVALLWVIFFIEWTDYYLDTWIITNQRVINIDQQGFFNREILTLRYPQIQDVTVEVRGPISTWLQFGSIQIETAGEYREIVMKQADNPEEIKSLILREQALVNRK